ncbi:hypothetical protein CL3_20240 [butyrate-producing bacterium SM4/1]|nr:hypothetical protein CLS_28960 [[Clostridium] cf. saccharolyticum K10]CBL36401.1 hypothetical protein CL3_20240 [butyrate-producing bacterium SM4/1]
MAAACQDVERTAAGRVLFWKTEAGQLGY